MDYRIGDYLFDKFMSDHFNAPMNNNIDRLVEYVKFLGRKIDALEKEVSELKQKEENSLE